ncbi:DMT family transporter [Candidatus Bipolaricaulota bacterium]|nr:DMT family transporter [Candidatus Bipolaricaulota bacterium]
MVIGVFLALAGALSHSISFITRKRGLEVADYKLFILVRVAVGLVVSGILLWAIGPGLSGLTPKMVLPFVLTGGLAGGFVALFTTTLAIHFIGASKAHAITSSSPLVTAVGEIIFLGAALTLQIILGTVLVVVGAALISFFLHRNDSGSGEEDAGEANRPIIGLAMALYTVLAIGAQVAMQKWGLSMGVSPLQGLFFHVLTAALLFGLYYLLLKPDLKIGKLGQLKYSGNFLVAAVAMAILPLLNLYALTFLSATVVAALMRVAPLFTVALTHFFLKGIERVNGKIVLSTFLIVTGAILVSLQ